jgi:NAD(P)-dependent dehydrogenase (short-subunit alcohol dehydrogenase family)
MDLELAGRRAVVTGGRSGIGRAIAVALAQEGCDVGIVARDVQATQLVAQEIAAATGRRVVALPADTGDGDAVTAMAGRAEQELGGPVAILVNAAARANTGAPLRDEELLLEINVKVAGYLRCARAFAPAMVEAGWGRIINIAGLAARSAGTVTGSVRNVAVSALTKNLADELGPSGVNVVVVHPGMTRTERTPSDASGSGNVIGRMVTAAEVADVVTFLASPRSVAITGDAIPVGGGVRGAIYY